VAAIAVPHNTFNAATTLLNQARWFVFMLSFYLRSANTSRPG